MRRRRPQPLTAEDQRAREEFDAFVASITPPDYDPTFDNEAVEDVGHLDGACDDVLELAARRTAGPPRSSPSATTAAAPSPACCPRSRRP